MRNLGPVGIRLHPRWAKQAWLPGGMSQYDVSQACYKLTNRASYGPIGALPGWQ